MAGGLFPPGAVLRPIVGVDPGQRGAVAMLRPDWSLVVRDIPMIDAKPRPIPDFAKLALIFDQFAKEAPSVMLERVWGRPTDGCSQAFAFGRCYGGLLAMAAAHFMPVAEVTPMAWRKAMGLPPKTDKDGSRALASKLLPASAHLWPLMKDHDRAEAALLALYGRQQAERAAA